MNTLPIIRKYIISVPQKDHQLFNKKNMHFSINCEDSGQRSFKRIDWMRTTISMGNNRLVNQFILSINLLSEAEYN